MRHLYRYVLVLVATLMLLLIATSPLYATSWDVTNDFSKDDNPNGVWSYGLKPSLTGTFELIAHNANLDGWMGEGGANLWKNYDSYTKTGVNPGEVSLHPGASGEYAVARWTSPVAGTINIDGKFGAGDSGVMSYFIYENGDSIFVIHGTYADGPFSLTATVSQGTIIDFMVGEGYGYGNTPLHATITGNPVPLPPSLLLFGSGLVGLAGLRRRFRKG